MSNPKQFQVLAFDDVMQVDKVPSQSSGQGQVAPQNRGRTKGQAQSSGKGKGKSKGTGRGNSRSTSRNPSQNRFSATIVCKFCNKTGHYDNRCWSKYPHLAPSWIQNKRPPSRPPQNRSAPPRPQIAPQAPPYTPIEEQTNPKKRKVNLFTTLALSLGTRVNGQEVETIIASGASMSVVSNQSCTPRTSKDQVHSRSKLPQGRFCFPWAPQIWTSLLEDEQFPIKLWFCQQKHFKRCWDSIFCAPLHAKVSSQVLNLVDSCMITKNTPFEKCITPKKRTKCTRSPTNCGRPSRTHSTPV